MPIESQVVAQRIELAVVIPTYNERQNVSPLLNALGRALVGIEWEAIFVDDHSPDGTADYIREVAETDRRVRVLERIGRRGLASACIEGMLATPAPYIAVMDGDLQHDECVLPRMLALAKSGRLDLVVASRNIVGGSIGETSPRRNRLSSIGRRLSRLVCHYDVSDPMSGFFLVRRAYFQQVVQGLTGMGFKILVDLLASGQPSIRLAEVPYNFKQRQWGKSKLDANAELEYLYLLVDKLIGTFLPTRFALFVLVGASGLVVHISTLGLLYYWMRASFVGAQIAATLISMTSNFLVNNLVTFRDRRLRGRRFITGILTFYLACSLGALINVSFADLLLRSRIPWYLAGISGMAVSSVWNYGVNAVLTWRRVRAHI